MHLLGGLKLDTSSAPRLRASMHPEFTPTLMQVPCTDTLSGKLNPTRSATGLHEPSNGFFRQGLMGMEHYNSRPRHRPEPRWAMAFRLGTCRTFPCPIPSLAISQLGA
jgi:hypothetical protein